jgi:hypothetical protein
MVIWVFAGGGEAELRGLSTFLRANFTHHHFEMKTPIRQKPGPRPDHYHALGYTGSALRQQIRFALEQALRGGICDCIFVLDDLDCRDLEQSTQAFNTTILQITGAQTVERVIAFAAPEIEAWLIADWDHSFRAYPELRRFEVQIRRALADVYRASSNNGDISRPENFSVLDARGDSCERKLSEQIIEVVRMITGISYSKDEHSGSMLQKVRAEVVQQSCPIFRRTLYIPLTTRIEDR